MPPKLTSLFAAAKKGDHAAANRFIRRGWDPNARDSEGLTPLMWSARKGHRNLAAALLKWGADADARDPQGQTALHHAVAGQHRAVIRTLAAAGADLNAKGPDDCTSFDFACLAGDYKTAKELMDLGARGSPPDPGIFSIGQERGDYLPIHETIDLLSLRLSELPERNPWGKRGHLRVIFHTPGPREKSDSEGIRKKILSKNKKLLVVQITVPKSLTKKRPIGFLLSSIHKAIDQAEQTFKRAKLEFPAAAARDYVQAIGAMKTWEFPDFRK